MKTSAGNVAVMTALLALAVACSKADDRIAVDTADRVAGGLAPAAAVPGTYTLDDFRRLRWLDGRWRGFMADGKTFYEQYRVVNDSTIVKHSFADSTFTNQSDSSRVQLRGGRISDESANSTWVVTRLDSTGVDFAPQRNATNYFTWAQESPTAWNATLRWTDNGGRPQSVVYALHKFGR